MANENERTPREWTAPQVERPKEQTVRARLLKGVVVAGFPTLKPNDVFECPAVLVPEFLEREVIELVDDESVVAVTKAPPKAEFLVTDQNGNVFPASMKRIRLTRGVVVRGFPQVAVGDFLTLPESQANELVGQGAAEIPKPPGVLKKLAIGIGL